MLLIAYDGSEHAEAAIHATAKIAPGAEVTILTVYESLMTDGGTPKSDAGFTEDVQAADDDAEHRAQAIALQGADVAGKLALSAVVQTVAAPHGVAEAILEIAEGPEFAGLIIGTHGATGLRSVLRGSVAHHILDHSRRPVVVVPSDTD